MRDTSFLWALALFNFFDSKLELKVGKAVTYFLRGSRPGCLSFRSLYCIFALIWLELGRDLFLKCYFCCGETIIIKMVLK